jgi:hypothetical protein
MGAYHDSSQRHWVLIKPAPLSVPLSFVPLRVYSSQLLWAPISLFKPAPLGAHLFIQACAFRRSLRHYRLNHWALPSSLRHWALINHPVVVPTWAASSILLLRHCVLPEEFGCAIQHCLKHLVLMQLCAACSIVLLHRRAPIFSS